MICNTVLDALGNTPLIRLNRLTGPEDAEVLVKFEGLNVGGSIKTRTAFQMIEAAEKEGIIGPDTVIVEPTSGNQGIGLSLVGAVKGYKVIIIMPDSVSKERRMLVRQYGAEVRLVHDRNNIGECIEKCIEMALDMAKEDPNVFIPNQFENYNNIEAHLQHTALESKVLKEANPEIAIVACEPDNAAILSGGNIGTHLQMGIGDGVIPAILDQSIYNDIRIVTDEEALETTRRLAAEEGILCGISSGTNVSVALKLAKELGRGKTVVTVLPDTGERYFSTILFE